MNIDKKDEYTAYANKLGEFAANLLNNGLVNTNESLINNNGISLKEEIKYYTEKVFELKSKRVEMEKNHSIVFNYIDIKHQQYGLEGNIHDKRVKKLVKQKGKQLKKKENAILKEDKENNNYLEEYWSICKELDLTNLELNKRLDMVLNQYLLLGKSLNEKISNLPSSEQEKILSSYIHSFYSNIDFEKVNDIIGWNEKNLNHHFLNTPKSDKVSFSKHMKTEIELSHKKEKLPDSIDLESCYLELKTSKLSELEEKKHFFHFTRESYLPQIVKEGLRGDLKDRENSVGKDDENPSIYFSDGEEALLKTADVWLKWEYNRLTYNKEDMRPGGDLVTDPEILKKTFELVFNDFKDRRYLSLDLVEGTDKTTSDFYRESEDFKKKEMLDKGGPNHVELWMFGPYTDWSSAQLEDWNMMTHIGGRYVEKDRITMLTDEHGRSDALSVLMEVYERQKDKNLDCTYLDSFMGFVHKKSKEMQEKKCRSIGIDVIGKLEKIFQTDEVTRFIESEAKKIDKLNISKEEVNER